MSSLRSRIVGIGTAVPPQVVTNEELAQLMDTDPAWIEHRTGIRQRRWAATDTTTSVSRLAAPAAERALEDAGLEREELDLIVFATLSPDAVFPGSGCFLQGLLDVPGIPTLDLRQQCTGFLWGLSVADLHIRAGLHRNVLVVGAEMQSKMLDKSTRGREMSVLFGDGAGAVVVQATELADPDARSTRESHLISHHFHGDGRHAEELILRLSGSANRVWNPLELVPEREGYPQMNGRLVFLHAVRHLPEVAREALEANGLEIADVDLVVNHQANQRINDRFAEVLDLPREKLFDTIDRYGNTTAATIPIGLAEAASAGRLERGMLVLSTAFGSGFTWAASLLRW